MDCSADHSTCQPTHRPVQTTPPHSMCHCRREGMPDVTYANRSVLAVLPTLRRSRMHSQAAQALCSIKNVGKAPCRLMVEHIQLSKLKRTTKLQRLRALSSLPFTSSFVSMSTPSFLPHSISLGLFLSFFYSTNYVPQHHWQSQETPSLHRFTLEANGDSNGNGDGINPLAWDTNLLTTNDVYRP